MEIHKIVAFGRLVHNVNEGTFRSRTLVNLVSNIAKPIVYGDSGAIFPHGVVSKYHFPWLTNPVTVVDPIESFGSHIQVIDDDDMLYQWEIARFEGIEGRHYGRWVSDYLDLREFDKTYVQFQVLMKLKREVGSESDQYIKEAEDYVALLQKLRSDAFNILLNVHEDLKKQNKKLSASKVVRHAPPLLSHFETMKVEDGEISTIASMAPVFYRATLKHCEEAERVGASSPVSAFVLDQIYEERAQAVIAAAACLEAIMNEVGSSKFEEYLATGKEGGSAT